MPRKKAKPKARMPPRNIRVSGYRTSVRLEPEIWDEFNEICWREGCTAHDISTSVNKQRGQSSLTSALRVFIHQYFRDAATEAGHAKARHGNLMRKS